MTYHYTYYSYEEFGRGYIGKRSCKCRPEEDVKYFGSYRDKTFRPTQKIILTQHHTVEEALTAEIRLHEFYDVAHNSHFANKAKQTSEKFSYDGTWEQRSETVKKWQTSKTPEQRSEVRRKQVASMTPEQRSEATKKGNLTKTPEQRSEAIRKGNLIRTSEQRSEIAKTAAIAGSKIKWQCTVTGFITNAGSLSSYQKARGIDTSNRIRIS